MALVTTPGAANADSFGTLEEAEAYFLGGRHEETWADLEEAGQEFYLRQAVRVLEGWPRAWTGSPVDATQALTWPRSGMVNRNGFAIPTAGASSIPTLLKQAQFELARQLGEEDRTEDSSLLAGIKSVTAGPVELEFAEAQADQRLALRRRDSLEAMIPDIVVMLIPASWLKDARDEDAAYNGFLFESLEE